jgi:hypothetical protein
MLRLEGSVIRALALCEGAVVKLLPKYTEHTVGPHSRIGGEVNNYFLAYSNKGHDGFRKLSAWGMV